MKKDNESELFQLAKAITKPKQDQVDILFETLRHDLWNTIRTGSVDHIEHNIGRIVYNYERHFRRMLAIKKDLK